MSPDTSRRAAASIAFVGRLRVDKGWFRVGLSRMLVGRVRVDKGWFRAESVRFFVRWLLADKGWLGLRLAGVSGGLAADELPRIRMDLLRPAGPLVPPPLAAGRRVRFGRRWLGLPAARPWLRQACERLASSRTGRLAEHQPVETAAARAFCRRVAA